MKTAIKIFLVHFTEHYGWAPIIKILAIIWLAVGVLYLLGKLLEKLSK